MDLKGGKFMDPRTFPTKGNLMLAKNSLSLARQGYDLMDKKRNILIRELMDLIEEARTIQEDIDSTFMYAYQCLQRANIENGISTVELLAYTVPIENSITIQTRSIMGTEIPHVKYVPDPGQPTYSFSTTRESIDKAREAFRKVKELTGVTPTDFLRNYRLKQAAALLRQKDCNVNEAAYATGFSSPPYFSKCFKAVYNITPTEFIESL